MWSLIFPKIWDNHLELNEKEKFKGAALLLLSKDYHLKQARVQPNVIQRLDSLFLS
jgi:hypothetical protein